jgi:hypothetical protein
MTPAGLLGTLSDWYERNKDRIYGGGVRGAATRGLLGVEAPQEMTPTQREVYENAVRIGAPALGAGKAIFIGAKAKTWNKEAAKRFEQLEKEGLSNREAFAQTGTFRSPDGELRQEISDTSANFDVSQLLPKGEPPSMQSIRELEKAQFYKQFLSDKKTPKKAAEAFEVKFGEKPSQTIVDAAGKYESSKDLFAETERLRSLRSYGPRPLVAEAIQHPELLEAYPEIGASTKIGRLQRGDAPGAMGAYRPTSNLIEVAVGASDPRSVVLHELQHAVQQREGFSPGGAGQSFSEYQRLAGEAEARAVQKRMDYTPRQRRDIFPLEDYDVPLDQLILRGLLSR